MAFIQALPSVSEALRWGDRIIDTKDRKDKVMKLNVTQDIDRFSDLKLALKNRQKG